MMQVEANVMEHSKEMYTFTEGDGVCKVLTPRTPRHWYNYLWSEEGYCAQVSQFGHGNSYYIDEYANLCRINVDSARYIYLRDDDSKSFWNIGEGPSTVPVDDYMCEHRLAATTLSSVKDGIRASWRVFVPSHGYHEVWTVKVKNTGAAPRKLSMFSVASFELEGFKYPRYYEMYRCCETSFETDLNGMFCKAAHPFAPHKRYNGYLSSSEPVAAYDGDLKAFVGTMSMVNRLDTSQACSYQRPDVVVSGGDCTNSTATNFILGGVLQHKLVLEPGEERTIHIVLGVSESLEEACGVSRQVFSPGKVEELLAETERFQQKKYGTMWMNTPDGKINSIMNSWLKKQVDFCIVGKKGVRDNLQIAVALLNFRADKAKQEILEVLRHQFQAGHAVLTWYPYDDTRYSDQPFWIVWSVIELIKETGDYSILEQELDYQDGGKGTVLEHMKAAVNRLLEDKGANGLTRIFFADWNDALNVTTDPEAESVMLSHQLCLALREFAALSLRMGDTEYAEYLQTECSVLREAINKHAWDGEWYARVLSKNGPIGSRESEGSKIYLNAQTWAVLAGVPDEERLPSVLRSIDSMEHDFGFPINMPPYMEYTPQVGRMSGMLPGLYENGGVYCHANGFKIVMDCMLGRAEEAIRTLHKIMPDSENNPSIQSGAEPYVFTNCYSIHPKYYGKSYQSWTTGTSAWALMGLYEGILGIKRDYDGLRIQPCLPSEWKEAEAYREFRGSRYHIQMKRAEGVSGGGGQIMVDGEPITGNILPLFQDLDIHKVMVLISE